MMRAATFVTIGSLCAVQNVSGVRPDVEDVEPSSTTTTTTQDMDSKIEWLLDFAGQYTVIKAIVDDIFGGKLELARSVESAEEIAYKEHVTEEVLGSVFIGEISSDFRGRQTESMEDVERPFEYSDVPYLVTEGYRGWRYMRKDKEKPFQRLESYGKHQKKDTRQFGQSFAQLYMLNDRWPQKKFGKEAITPHELQNALKEGEFGANIKVIVKYWKAVFYELKKMGKEVAKLKEAEEEEEADEEEEEEEEKDEDAKEEEKRKIAEREKAKDMSERMLAGLNSAKWELSDYRKLVDDDDNINFAFVKETLHYIRDNAGKIAEVAH